MDPKKLSSKMISHRPYFEKRIKKENEGKMTWTVALYATPAMAKEAKMTLEEYRNQIITACYLDQKDPIKKWKEIMKNIESVKNKLDKMKIERVHIK
ncbi:MAG: aminopeptidase [bacterium]